MILFNFQDFIITPTNKYCYILTVLLVVTIARTANNHIVVDISTALTIINATLSS